MPRQTDFGYFQIALRGEEHDYPALIEVSSFLYDFNLLYEFSRLVVDPKYDGYRFSSYSTYRNARRVDADDRLEVQGLRLESPIELTAIVIALPAAAGALWVMTQTLEKIVNFPVNHDILKLQREKLKRELQSTLDDGALPKLPQNDVAFREQIHIREADRYFDRVTKHLDNSPVRVREIEITLVRELPAKRRS